MVTQTTRLVSSRLVSAILLALMAVLAPCEKSFADPPCAVMSVAPEGGESICLDDWIRFNQKLWVDLFWPNAFDVDHPFIFVDERLGLWAIPDSTTGQNEQGDHVWIDASVAPELINFQELLADGTIDATQYQLILTSETTAANVVAVMTSQEAGWQVVMHAFMISTRLPSGEYMNLISPYEEFDFKAVADPLVCGPCVVAPCECPGGGSPGESQTAAYAVHVCNKICEHNARRQVIINDLRKCQWATVGLSALGVVGGCLGIACGAGAPAGVLVIGASFAGGAKELGDCKSTKEAAFLALDVALDQFRQLKCLEACIATPPQP